MSSATGVGDGPVLRSQELPHGFGGHTRDRDAFISAVFAADDVSGTAGKTEEAGQVLDERLVGGAVDRRRRQPHDQRRAAHAAERRLSRPGNHTDVDLDARVCFTNQGRP